MDEHTDWINKLIYLKDCNSLLSCSNDTSIKLWKLPEDLDPRKTNDEFTGEPIKPRVINSFFTFDSHNDYVRSMAFSLASNRLFSISDDGVLIINDISQNKIVSEYKNSLKKYPLLRNSKYVPVYQVDDRAKLVFGKLDLANFKS